MPPDVGLGIGTDGGAGEAATPVIVHIGAQFVASEPVDLVLLDAVVHDLVANRDTIGRAGIGTLAADFAEVVDTDVHHGDGTQDIYWNDPDTLCISLHQDGRTLYPGSGFPDEFGGPNALGTTINVPLPPETSDEGFLHVLEELILPIIAEFKPDLVINSAGQDNHYTDPITNMRFSAQGYARLNELLNPHIAVLEGGYSIEGALPYVNVGIILAMAGLDYSHVREPDYNRESIRQSVEITKYIRETTKDVLDLWKKRDSFKAGIVKGAKYARRNRNIYYDTDGIREQQEETVRICDDCGGFIAIDSMASTGNRVYAVIKGVVSAGVLMTSGKINGTITAVERIQILKPGVLVGDIRTPSIAIEEGSHFHGMCDMGMQSWEEPRAISIAS